MRVVLDRNLVTRRVSIYVFPAESVVAGERDGEVTLATFRPGDVPEPTYVIDERWFNEIVREALRDGGVPEPDALADARAMRDRLLAMVEAEWAARVEGRS
jgi:hypothetical protein